MMQQARPRDLPYSDFPWPPTEDELPYDDGMPMESHRHVLQATLLTDALAVAWADRDDVFVGANMFVYFSPDQVLTEDYRGPDVFVVLGAEKRERKSWVVWQEQKAPDVVIELLSESTAQRDKTEKKLIYQDKLRVPEYFWYDPYSGEMAGFRLQGGVYQPIGPADANWLPSLQLGLSLVRWQGVYRDEEALWLRWAGPDGALLPTAWELAVAERERAEAEQRRADEERARAEAEQQRADEERARAEAAEQRAEAERQIVEALQRQVDAMQMQLEVMGREVQAAQERAALAEQHLPELIERLDRVERRVDAAPDDAD